MLSSTSTQPPLPDVLPLPSRPDATDQAEQTALAFLAPLADLLIAMASSPLWKDARARLYPPPTPETDNSSKGRTGKVARPRPKQPRTRTRRKTT